VRLLLFHGDYKGVGDCPLDMARRVRVFGLLHKAFEWLSRRAVSSRISPSILPPESPAPDLIYARDLFFQIDSLHNAIQSMPHNSHLIRRSQRHLMMAFSPRRNPVHDAPKCPATTYSLNIIIICKYHTRCRIVIALGSTFLSDNLGLQRRS
jgi:hypothetical protein